MKPTTTDEGEGRGRAGGRYASSTFAQVAIIISRQILRHLQSRPVDPGSGRAVAPIQRREAGSLPERPLTRTSRPAPANVRVGRYAAPGHRGAERAGRRWARGSARPKTTSTGRSLRPRQT